MYLNEKSHHDPTQMQQVENSLVSRAYWFTEPKGRKDEMQETTKALQQNVHKEHWSLITNMCHKRA